MSKSNSTKLLTVMERAKDPSYRFRSLGHHVNCDLLNHAFERLREDAATGIDGVTKEVYRGNASENIQQLHQRLRELRWRHQPIRRVLIPKGRGKARPIGISCIEDKVVQGALATLLSAVYEPIFSEGSFGFRPGRSAHGALRMLREATRKRRYILEADIVSFFDSIDRTKLLELLWERIADKSIKRLVGKCLHVGVLEGTEYSEPETGTAQGSVLSPILGNIYLHYVLDDWFERDVQPQLSGRATLVRYADDFAIAFEQERDAKRVMEVLKKRFARFGLLLHPEKTRLLRYCPPDGSGEGGETFDFLGFTFCWTPTRKGGWRPGMKTKKESLRRFLVRISEWCRRNRHLPVWQQHRALCRRLNGYFNYFAINGNRRGLEQAAFRTAKIWRKWLDRRSQRSAMTWTRFRARILRNFPLPKPRIRVQIW